MGIINSCAPQTKKRCMMEMTGLSKTKQNNKKPHFVSLFNKLTVKKEKIKMVIITIQKNHFHNQKSNQVIKN